MDSKVLRALLMVVAMTVFGGVASAAPGKAPRVTILEDGARIAAVTIETYGVAKPYVVRRYLSLHEGDRLRTDRRRPRLCKSEEARRRGPAPDDTTRCRDT